MLIDLNYTWYEINLFDQNTYFLLGKIFTNFEFFRKTNLLFRTCPRQFFKLLPKSEHSGKINEYEMNK